MRQYLRVTIQHLRPYLPNPQYPVYRSQGVDPIQIAKCQVFHDRRVVETARRGEALRRWQWSRSSTPASHEPQDLPASPKILLPTPTVGAAQGTGVRACREVMF